MTVAIYEDEDVTNTRLSAWRQWRLGDGVKGQVRTIAFHEDEAVLRRELNRDTFRLPSLVSDAEHTDRAIAMMRKEDPKAWLALECYHLANSATRRVARACKAHHTEVPAILRRAHSLFRYCRAETAPMARIENPSTRAPLQPATA